MNKKAIVSLSAAIAAVTAGHALALEPESIPVGEMSFVPTLKLSEGYDDNIWEAADNDPQRPSSAITQIAPSFVLSAKDRLNTYQLSYSFLHEIFHSSHDDDHTDHHLAANGHLEFDARQRLDLNAGYDKMQDTRDSTNRTNNEEGNKHHAYNVGALYGFGAESAKGQIEVGAGFKWDRYDNNYDSGSLTREKDRDTASLSGTFYYRVAPKTRALFELRYNDYDYVSTLSPTGGLDSDSITYLAGVTWDATAKTSGSVKLGREEKDFDDSAKNDPDNTTWEVSVTWEPLTYSSFTLKTNSLVDEGSSTEDYIDSQTHSLAWNHQWFSYLSSDVSFSRQNKEYKGGSNDGRDDDIDTFGVDVTYKARRWLDLGLGFKFKDADSTDSNSAFDRESVVLSANISL